MVHAENDLSHTEKVTMFIPQGFVWSDVSIHFTYV